MSEKLDASWERRKRVADEWNKRMANGEIHPSILKRILWDLQACTPSKKYRKLGGTYGARRAALEKRWRMGDKVSECRRKSRRGKGGKRR